MKDKKAMERKMLEIFAKYAMPYEDKVIIKERGGSKNKITGA